MCVKVPKGGWWKTPMCKKQKKTVHVKSRSDYLKYQEVPVGITFTWPYLPAKGNFSSHHQQTWKMG